MSTKILMIEDDNKLREFITIYLKKEGYTVVEAINGEEGLAKFSNDIDLVLLDIMMPKLNGFEVCKGIRDKSDVPIIFLTAMASDDYHVEGYELGADDYVTKPFKSKILIAKIKRLLQKNHKDVDHLQFGVINLDTLGHSISVNGQVIDFAPREYNLLTYLMTHEKQALSREQLLIHVWGYDFEGEGRVVDNHIKKIRKKLGHASAYIKTVKGVGYKFEVTHEE